MRMLQAVNFYRRYAEKIPGNETFTCAAEPAYALRLVCKCMLLFTVLFGISVTSEKLFAQPQPLKQFSIIIHGVVKDSLSRPLSSVTVSCIRLRDSVAVKQLTDIGGAYSFVQKDTGDYIIAATHAGYRFYKSKPFVIAAGIRDITVPDIILYEEVKVLKEVTVTAAPKKLFEATAGKLIMNVEQSAAAAGSSAFELLQRTPGITIDQNDNLLLKGSATVNVMIDGKMTYLSAQQLSNMLKSMPAENISRIEVISNPPAQYDAAGNAGIINIVTKKSNKLGYAADISAGIGFGHYVLHTENITGNIRTRRFNFFGSFGYDLRRTYRTNHTVQISDNGSIYIHFTKDNIQIIKSNSYSYKAGADIYLSKTQQFGFVVSSSHDDWITDINGPTTLKNNIGQITATVQNGIFATQPYSNNTYNINYQFTPDTSGKMITADANYIYYRNNSDGYISNQEFDMYGDSSQPFQKLLYHQPNNIDVRSVKTDLTYPLLKGKLKAGLKYSSVTIDNNFRYDSLINDEYKFSPSLSDHFIYTEQISAAYLSFAKQWTNTFVEAGIRAEHTISNGNSISTGVDTKRHYTNLFPAISMDEQLDKNDKISVALSRRIDRPSYGSLNPVRNFIDKYSYFQGNPYLNPELSWRTSLSYTWRDKYIATLSYNRVNNYISIAAQIDTAGTYILSRVNYAYSGLWDLSLITPFTLFSFWSISAVTTVSYRYYPVFDAMHTRTVKKLYADVLINQTFNTSKFGVFELNAHYTSPQLYGLYTLKYYLSVDGGYKKTLIKKRLDMKCSFTDLFHSTRAWGSSFLSTINYKYEAIRDSRRFRLTLTYHLGGKLSGGKSHSIEEENRM